MHFYFLYHKSVILKLWKHVLKFHYGHVHINREKFIHQPYEKKFKNKIREENWRRNKFEVWRPCWKNEVAGKDTHVKISDTHLYWGLERQKAWSGSQETTGEAEPLCNTNHTNTKGSQYVECQYVLPGRGGRAEENSSGYLRMWVWDCQADILGGGGKLVQKSSKCKAWCLGSGCYTKHTIDWEFSTTNHHHALIISQRLLLQYHSSRD